MATGENCYGLEAGINRLDNVGSERNAAFDASKAAKGKETFNNLLRPMREAVEREKTATGDAKRAAVKDVNSFYDKGKGSEKNLRKETMDLTSSLQADSDVHRYIRNMTPDEFGNARKEVNDRFGGDQARMMERQYVNKLYDYEEKLNSSGKMIPSIQDRISTTRARGEMSDSDLNVMRGLEEYLSLGDEAFGEGKARGTYNSLGRKLGDDIAQDIFAEKVATNLDNIANKMGNQNILDTAFGKSLNADEIKVLEDYKAIGKVKTDATALETTAAMLRKMDQSALSALKKTVDPLNELPQSAKYGVMGKVQKSRVMRTVSGIGT